MGEKTWIDILAPHDRHNEIVAMGLFMALGIPESYFDVGSGTGAMVNFARKLGVDAWGVDQISRDDEHLIQHDLAWPLDLGRTFDVVSCIEVAEHIPQIGAEVLCDTLARHVRPEGLLVFTSALPGQKGEGHVNAQPPEYWRNELYQRGLYLKTELTWRLALLWLSSHHPLMWLAPNLQVFQKFGLPTE